MKAMLCAVLAAAVAVFCACRVLSAPETAPATPRNLRIIDGPDGSPNLAWDAVPGARGYRVYCSPTWTEWPELNDRETSATSMACHSESYCCEGYFTVSAFNSGGESAKAEPPVLNGPPAAPRNVRIDNSSSPHRLRWEAVLGAESYRIYWYDMPSPDTPVDLSSPSGSASAGGTEYPLSLPGHHTYWVTSMGMDGESEPRQNGTAYD